MNRPEAHNWYGECDECGTAWTTPDVSKLAKAHADETGHTVMFHKEWSYTPNKHRVGIQTNTV